jgi:hypothetical protein
VVGGLYLTSSVLVSITSHLSVSDHQNLILCGRFFHQHLDETLYKHSYQIDYIPNPSNLFLTSPIEKRGRKSPLWRATENNRVSTMEKILAAGALADVRVDARGPILLSQAASLGRVRIVRLLLKYGDVQMAQLRLDETPLQRAKLMKLVLELCLIPEGLAWLEDVVPDVGMTPLQISLEEWKRGVVRMRCDVDGV